VTATQPTGDQSKAEKDASHVHSLLENDLGVALALHISLSRPLVLKTAQKDSYLTHLQKFITENSIKALTLQPKDLAWHPNESGSRWFLVVRLQKSAELDKLLQTCNEVAKAFKQPLLYAETDKPKGDEFHISIAWSLQAPRKKGTSSKISRSDSLTEQDIGIPYSLLQRLSSLEISFAEVKVRIGQDVNLVGLKPKR